MRRNHIVKKMSGFAALAAAILMLFSLSACSSDPSETGKTEKASTSATLPYIPAIPGDSEQSAEGSTAAEDDPTDEPPGPTETEKETDTEYVGPEFEYTRMPERVLLYPEDFGITRYQSPLDKDGDGIDDQTDIFLGAKAYVAQDLRYNASSYYAEGYPEPAEDGHIDSVCTDVVGAALVAAGYDLRALVDQDIRNHREWYTTDISAYGSLEELERQLGDSKIDFRRVRNLWVFFEHHADSLTLDLSDQGAWQPGDIAVFWDTTSKIWKMHIVIISDRRASDGVPYVLHHASTGQTLFEEDYMVSATKQLIGHYRWTGYNGE
ncbi:MAG: DUF1287 domain-containing protein [Lachnospiraceae bacterium]|nr:DUF1287 domain-containing protein [Lachnospiraceae bacterium]